MLVYLQGIFYYIKIAEFKYISNYTLKRDKYRIKSIERHGIFYFIKSAEYKYISQGILCI